MNFKTTIYLADDDPDDRQFIIDAMVHANYTANIVQVEDGTQLINSLKGLQGTSVSLILLDVNMPKMNGIEALTILKSEAGLDNIPTIMITTALDKERMAAAYSAGVYSFITKPSNSDGYDRLVKFLQTHFRL